MAVAILAATQVGRGRHTPVAPITDYACAARPARPRYRR